MKILLAEDDDPTREMMRLFLSDLGHDVTPVVNGAELVKIALNDRPDLIVTDMHMPEMAGNSMIAMIDMYPPLTGIPVIMVTGASEDELAEAGIPTDVVVMGKPVDFDVLTAEINKVAQHIQPA